MIAPLSTDDVVKTDTDDGHSPRSNGRVVGKLLLSSEAIVAASTALARIFGRHDAVQTQLSKDSPDSHRLCVRLVEVICAQLPRIILAVAFLVYACR